LLRVQTWSHTGDRHSSLAMTDGERQQRVGGQLLSPRRVHLSGLE